MTTDLKLDYLGWAQVVAAAVKELGATSVIVDEASRPERVPEVAAIAELLDTAQLTHVVALAPDGNLVHASPPNITPYPRKIVYLTLCAVSNHITKFTRPEWIAHRDFTPIEPLGDDALLELARAYHKAA